MARIGELAAARIERAVIAMHADALGRVFAVSYVSGYRGERQIEVAPREGRPLVVRVLATSREDLLHWTDGEHCDPYWNVELVEPDARLVGVSSLWTFGRSPTDDSASCILGSDPRGRLARFKSWLARMAARRNATKEVA